MDKCGKMRQTYYIWHMADFPKNLDSKLSDRLRQGSLRTLGRPVRLTDFSSNDYLGLAHETKIEVMAREVLREFSNGMNGATGSRLLTGNHPLYTALESLLAETYGAEALVYNSGYDANLGFFSSVPQRGDVVFYDELVHASIRDGMRLGNARTFKFAHNNFADLEALAQGQPVANGHSRFVVTESVFSMDGDSPDLRSMERVCAKHGLLLILDEAHAVGVLGENGHGPGQALGSGSAMFARIITFGKAFGAHGAAVLGSKPLKEFLVNFSRSFIYTTGLPPHSIAVAMAAHRYAYGPKGQEVRAGLLSHIGTFKVAANKLGLDSLFVPSGSAIQCAIVPGNSRVREAARLLGEAGFDVRPILSPTVPEGKERLRFCLHASQTKDEIEGLLNRFKVILSEI